MIEIDLADYNTEVRLRNGDKGLRFRIPPTLIHNTVGVHGVGDLITQINTALREIQTVVVRT